MDISNHTRQRSFLNDPYVKAMIEKIAQCYELYEALCSQIRRLSQAEQQAAYDVACLEWEQSDKPNSVPIDGRSRKPFFEKCQAMMQSTPTTTKDQLLVTFACHAMRAGLGLELDPHPKKNQIMGEANRVAVERMLKAQEHSLSSPKHSNLPPHIMQALLPNNIDDPSSSDCMAKPGGFLVGKSFKYRDGITGLSVACLVQDCGTSHLMGDWFEISECESEEPLRITKNEMAEIWEARVTELE